MYKNLFQPHPPLIFFAPLMDIIEFNFQHFCYIVIVKKLVT